MSERPIDRRAKAAVRRSKQLAAETERSAKKTEELSFASRQARTVAQMLRYLRRERRKTG